MAGTSPANNDTSERTRTIGQPSKTLAPGSPASAEHSTTVN